MPYATQDDLAPQRLDIQQLVQLTTEAGAIQPNASVVDAALEKASAVVDSYCGQRYTLPLNQSNLAKELTADIAVYRLYQRRGQVKEGSAQALAYRDAIAMLKDISNGKASLDVAPTAQPQQSSGAVIVTQIPQVFDHPNDSGCNGGGWL